MRSSRALRPVGAHLLWHRRAVALTIVATLLASLALGLWLSFPGVATWDDQAHLVQSRWLLGTFGLYANAPSPTVTLKWYGPLWELVLGLFADVLFAFLRDPIWIRHALTFTLFPVTLIVTGLLLRRIGCAMGTTLLAVAMLFGVIRWGGHSLVNVKDAPLACLFLLVTLYLWALLREGHEASGRRGYSWKTLGAVGVVSVVPYLTRPPALFHFAGAIGFLAVYSVLVAREATAWKRMSVVLLPILAGSAFVWALFPTVREYGFEGWLGSFALFRRFPMERAVRLFGTTYQGGATPWWYALSWIPVIVNPVVAVLFACGIVSLVVFWRRVSKTSHAFRLQTRCGAFNLSFALWLALVVLGSWGTVLWLNPAFYDEERHTLFLFPPLFLLAALGLDPLPRKVKCGIAALVVAASLWSYAGWGKYAYVYKSPIIGDISARSFMGDYWGVCVSEAVSGLQGRAPAGATVIVESAGAAAFLQEARLREGLVSRRAGFPGYRINGPLPERGRFYAIGLNRIDESRKLLEDVAHGEGRLIWSTDMPPGEPSCILVEFDRR